MWQAGDHVLPGFPRLRCRGQCGELLQVQDTLADLRQGQEFNQVTARLKALETAFLADLDRVDRGVMTEPEYLKRHEVRRSARVSGWVGHLEARTANSGPGEVTYSVGRIKKWGSFKKGLWPI